MKKLPENVGTFTYVNLNVSVHKYAKKISVLMHGTCIIRSLNTSCARMKVFSEINVRLATAVDFYQMP